MVFGDRELEWERGMGVEECLHILSHPPRGLLSGSLASEITSFCSCLRGKVTLSVDFLCSETCGQTALSLFGAGKELRR